MTEVIVSLCVLFLLVVVMFILLKQIVAKVNEQSKLYFTLKLQEYDDLIKERESKLEKVREKEKTENLEEEIKNNIEPSTPVYDYEMPDYQMEGLLENIKKVEDRFRLNEENIIKLFLENHPDDVKSKRYNNLNKLKKYIDNIGVYNIMANEDSEYFDKLLNELRNIDNEIINDYTKASSKVDVEDFLNYLDNEIHKFDPYVYVEVGDKDTNFNHLSKRIKTIYNKNICKGIIIIHKNKMYDYSLK